MLSLSQEDIIVKIDAVNWEYKVGDNIKHNLDSVFYLYKVKAGCSNKKEHLILNKYIFITLSSIIEALLYDFVVRLCYANSHFPSSIDYDKKMKIKKHITAQRILHKDKNSLTDNYRVKNYSFIEVVRLLKKFELLEHKDSRVYNLLEDAIHLRNRLHIYNWFQNYEIDEEDVFTNKRLDAIEKLFEYILNKMKSKYSRPR